MTEDERTEHQESRSRRTYRYRIPVIAAIIAIVFAGLVTAAWMANRGRSISAGFGSGPVDVVVAGAVKCQGIVSTSKVCTVMPLPDAVVNSPHPAWVREWKADSGDRVNAGQVLVLLQRVDKDAEEAVTSLQLAQQNVQIARTAVFAAQSHLDATVLALDMEEQKLAQAQRALAVAQAAEKQAIEAAASAAVAVEEYGAALENSRNLYMEGAMSQQEFERDEAVLKQAVDRRGHYNSSVKSAESRVAAAKKTVADLRQSVEDAKSNVARARAALAAAHEGSDQQELSARKALAVLEKARPSQNAIVLRSPVEGEVTEVAATPGALVTPASPILAIKPLNIALAAFDASEDELRKLKKGTHVMVHPPGKADALQGAVAAIPADGATGKPRRVIVQVKDAKAALKPGAKVDAKVVWRKVPAVGVPVSAVKETKDGAEVWVVRDGKADSIPVTLISTEKDVAAVRGIHAGDTVIVTSEGPLKSGLPVNVTHR